MVERDEIIEGWNVAWEHGLWAAPWSRALEGLTVQHAVWNYHIGQIMQLRAMQGFAPIE